MTKQKKTTEIASPVENEIPTTDQIYDMIKFATAAYGGSFQGVFTPDLINARMKDISLSPQMATSDKINSALLDPKNNEQQLIGYSQFLELNNMLFRRILLYFAGLLSFDFTYIVENIKDPKEYDSSKFKKDLSEVENFFNKFNVKQEFRTALKQMLRQEAFYSLLRDDGTNKYILQELPQQYCKITGRWENGLLFDFNMYWFWLPTVSLDMYPKIFTKIYNKIFKKPTTTEYNPASAVDSRTGSWVYWTQTSPDDGFTCFKLFPEIATIVPFLSPLMPDAVLQPVIRQLQTNSYIQQASKLLFGQIPMLKDTKSTVANQISMTPEVAGKFLALMKSGISDVIKLAAAPMENTSAIEFTGSDTIYNSYLQTTASSSGINSRLIYTTDRQNMLETKLGLDLDQNVLRSVYSQFEDMLNFWINKRTKYYKFKITLEGFETTTNREERLSNVTKLSESGIVLEQKFASAIGMSPFDFRRMLEESKANKFVDKLTPILKSAQMGGSGSGRPSKPDSQLTDSGEQTRSDGENEDG